METYISILRGINVSGQKKIKMLDLKILYKKLGFTDVQTYIQSGNVVFKSLESEKSSIKAKIEVEISKQYGFEVPVLILDLKELGFVFENNPFINKQNEDISKLHVTFLAEIPKKEECLALDNMQSDEDKLIISEKIIYIFCPNGYGRTKLNNNFFEKKLKTTATTRNWKTVSKLRELSMALV